MLEIVLSSVVDDLMMFCHATTGHLASYMVCTFHLIIQMLRLKSQRCSNLFVFTSILKPTFFKISIMSFGIYKFVYMFYKFVCYIYIYIYIYNIYISNTYLHCIEFF